jgi:hypothetical protein
MTGYALINYCTKEYSKLSTNLNKGCHSKLLAGSKHVLDVKIWKHSGNEEDSIGSLGAGVVDLPDVDNELLAK